MPLGKVVHLEIPRTIERYYGGPSPRLYLSPKEVFVHDKHDVFKSSHSAARARSGGMVMSPTGCANLRDAQLVIGCQIFFPPASIDHPSNCFDCDAASDECQVPVLAR